MPKLTEWEKAQGVRAPRGAKRQLPVCHLCGREFGTASLKIHLRACSERYEREKGKPPPPPPEMLEQMARDGLTPSDQDWANYNEAAYEASKVEVRRQRRPVAIAAKVSLRCAH